MREILHFLPKAYDNDRGRRSVTVIQSCSINVCWTVCTSWEWYTFSCWWEHNLRFRSESILYLGYDPELPYQRKKRTILQFATYKPQQQKVYYSSLKFCASNILWKIYSGRIYRLEGKATTDELSTGNQFSCWIRREESWSLWAWLLVVISRSSLAMISWYQLVAFNWDLVIVPRRTGHRYRLDLSGVICTLIW